MGGVRISNSVCIDAIHTDQEAAPQGGDHHALHGPASAAGWVALTSPALLHSHSQAARRQHRNNSNEVKAEVL